MAESKYAFNSAIYVTVKSDGIIPANTLVYEKSASSEPATKRRKYHQEDGLSRSRDAAQFLEITSTHSGTPLGITPDAIPETSEKTTYLAIAISGACGLTKVPANVRPGDSLYLQPDGRVSQEQDANTTHLIGRVITPAETEKGDTEILLQIINLKNRNEKAETAQAAAAAQISRLLVTTDSAAVLAAIGTAFTHGSALPDVPPVNAAFYPEGVVASWENTGGQKDFLTKLLATSENTAKLDHATNLYHLCPSNLELASYQLADILELPLGIPRGELGAKGMEIAIRALFEYLQRYRN